MASLEELDFLIETAQLERALAEAKEAHEGDRDDPDKREAFVAAKDAVRAHRQYWRSIRELIQAADGTPAGVAAPATHGMGVTPEGV